ncbi:c-type cytochrome [Arcobacter arenosus]|uniref:c-type cytochrome n=1 Tax=Arcobacter arenosus TaxID=2576037 RepID=UPI003BACA609
MNIKTFIAFSLLSTSALLAQTTMCFKENHSSMATIESTPLDGGLCSSTKSLADMKKEGWSVDDIKIEQSTNGKNYIYILKKEAQTLSSMDEEKLEQRIMQRLEKRQEQEKQAKITQFKQMMSKSGKKIYIDKCQSCHGEKAEKRAYGTSRPLVELSLDDMDQSINDYMYDNYDRGNAHVMKPYATFLTGTKVKEVYSYIQSLKPKKEEPKEDKKEESSN